MADISKIKIGGTSYSVKDTTARSTTYTTTLTSSGWSGSSGAYTYTASISGLLADNPPIVTYSTNQSEYNYITKGEASTGLIVFTASTKPSSDIGLYIIDIH